MLEDKQEVPFWFRMIVTRVRRRLVQQDDRLPEGQRTDAGKDHRHPNHVLPNLPWEKIVGLRLQLYLRTPKSKSRTCASKDKEMQPSQPNEGCRKYHDVDDKEPAQGHLAWDWTSFQEAGQEVADHRNFIHDLDADGRGPKGPLVPWKEIACEAESHDEGEECQSNHPDELPRLFIGAPEKDLR